MLSSYESIQEEERKYHRMYANSDIQSTILSPLLIDFMENYETFALVDDENRGDDLILLDDMRTNLLDDSFRLKRTYDCSSIPYDWSLFNDHEKTIAESCVCCVSLAPTLMLIPLVCNKCNQLVCGAGACISKGICPYCREKTTLTRVPLISQLLNALPVCCGNCKIMCTRAEFITLHLNGLCPFYKCKICREVFQDIQMHRMECKYTGLNSKSDIRINLDRNETINGLFRAVKDGKLKNNFVVAGGSVLYAMLHDFNKFDKAYLSSDFDLFIYGLDTITEAKQMIADIFGVIENLSCGYDVSSYIISEHAVTIRTIDNAKIQIILRLYRDITEILMGFDVDSCCVAYDGTTLWALPRSRYAIQHRCNTVDIHRRSTSYENRLWKYSRRGFKVRVPRPPPETDQRVLALYELASREYNDDDKALIYDICMDTKSSGFKLLLRAHFLQKMFARSINKLGEIFKDVDRDYDLKSIEVVVQADKEIFEQKLSKVTLITENPGRQGLLLSGSFYPLDPLQWFSLS